LQLNNISDPGSAQHHSNGSNSTSELISAGHAGTWQHYAPMQAPSQTMRPGMIGMNSVSSAGTLVASQSFTSVMRTLPVKAALPAALPSLTQTQVSSISTASMSQPPIVVPADAAGQMRVMHLLLLRMGSGNATEALRDFEEKCLPVVSSCTPPVITTRKVFRQLLCRKVMSSSLSFCTTSLSQLCVTCTTQLQSKVSSQNTNIKIGSGAVDCVFN
jgi:hypothetical protein